MRISRLKVFRSNDGATNDITSANVWVQIELGMDDTSNIGSARLLLEYSNSSFEAIYPDLYDIGAAFGVTDPANLMVVKTLYVGALDVKSNWYFTLRFSAGTDEAPNAYDYLPASEAPITINKNNRGVAIGQKSTATEDKPKFEVNWPVYFNGGIADFAAQWTYITPINGTTPGDWGGGWLRWMKIGPMVIIRGSVNITPGSANVVIADIPFDLEPAYNEYAFVVCGSARIARIFVGGYYGEEETRSKLILEWVRNLSDGNRYTGSTWVQCNITYFVETGQYG